jgi:hypothetical protein
MIELLWIRLLKRLTLSVLLVGIFGRRLKVATIKVCLTRYCSTQACENIPSYNCTTSCMFLLYLLLCFSANVESVQNFSIFIKVFLRILH